MLCPLSFSLRRSSTKMSFWKTGPLPRRTKSSFPSTFFVRETMKKQPPAAIPPAPVSKPAWEGQPGDLPIVFFGPHWHRIDFRNSWMGLGWQPIAFGSSLAGQLGRQTSFGVMVSVQGGCTVPFATKFCCKNNRIEKIKPVFSLKSLPMRSLRPPWGVLTTPKLVLLPMGSGKLLRSSFRCQKRSRNGPLRCAARRGSPWTTSIGGGRLRAPYRPFLLFS